MHWVNTMMSENAIVGAGDIWAEVVCDSQNIWGDRVTTYRLHYPRFIHSEFMTHRMVSKNASSSRAIPVHSMLKTIEDQPALPIHWGMNQPGMQADKVGDAKRGESLWRIAAEEACQTADAMWDDGNGFHKQVVNRVLEPFTFMNVVATATDWENFFWLRYHADAQPEIAELARVMWEARQQSTPVTLRYGEYHLPYVDSFRDNSGMLQYCDDDGDQVYSLDEAIKISSSCCAQASYRKLDQSLEKAIGLYDRLVGGDPLHASPFEHPCMPYSEGEHIARTKAKTTMVHELVKSSQYTRDQADTMADISMYCGNFRGFTQYRKMMSNENVKKVFEKS